MPIFGLPLLGVLLAAVCFGAGYLLFHSPRAGDLPHGTAETPATASAPASAPAPAMPATTAADTQPAPGLLVITKAVYGDLPGGPSTDVTAKVAALVTDNALNVAVGNELFGDPAAGIEKKLRVDYTIDGAPATKIVPEYQGMHLRAGPLRLVISKAVYGDLPNGTTADVTKKIEDLALRDSLSVEASNDVFGDPAVGIEKKLRVDYRFDGAEKSKTVNEGETLVISNLGF